MKWKYSYHSDPRVTQGQKQPWHWPNSDNCRARCISGDPSHAILSSLGLQLHLTPKQPHKATPQGPFFLLWIPWPPFISPLPQFKTYFPYLLKDTHEGLDGEPKPRFALPRHKWRIRTRERELMQEWLGFSIKHWTGNWALRKNNCTPIPYTTTTSAHTHKPIRIQRPRAYHVPAVWIGRITYPLWAQP